MEELSQITTAFSDSENGSTACFGGDSSADVAALRRLSENLGSLFLSPESGSYTDARIAVGSSELRVHRCVLSARSPFFREVFANLPEKEKVKIGDLVKELDVSYEALVAVLQYIYTGQAAALPKGLCVCVDEECSHVGCRPVVDFMVQMLYVSFTFQIFELANLFQRRLLDVLDKVAADDIVVILSVAKLCSKYCSRLVDKCIDIVVRSDVDIITLEKALCPETVKQIMDLRLSLGLLTPQNRNFPDKHARRIHRALESDDIELVRMLLKEGHTTLDDACALHYAVAYCDPKITTEILDLGLVDVNHRNLRGYTVLHIAAMRKEPKIMVSLLTKGARPSDLTSDGRKPLQISKRLTNHEDYNKTIEQGQASPKGRLCIEILEQAERKDPQVGEASVSLAMAGDELREKLLYLENRVALARMMFPEEARVAMDIAQVDGTSEFTSNRGSNHLPGNQRTTVDLNETPFKVREEHLARIRALSKTVELGKRFFPRASAALNKLMDDDAELTCLGKDTTEEKKRRYYELQAVLRKACSEDKEERTSATSPPSSSSTSGRVVRAKR
ncbi:BTB/POZ domain and ankyrin repeat-containing protein NPR1-like [Typha latifolia]|uniref:BTB/POZ domain and ankyrin repeat-containing protein NPR1-like n=1 Tax=Typha latifolia TaxID=4733 RepID=UPI003C2B3843